MPTKITVLEEAMAGFFTDHHAGILRMMLDNIDGLSVQIAALDAKIEKAIAPFAAQLEQLDQSPRSVPPPGRSGSPILAWT
jgi:transposase